VHNISENNFPPTHIKQPNLAIVLKRGNSISKYNLPHPYKTAKYGYNISGTANPLGTVPTPPARKGRRAVGVGEKGTRPRDKIKKSNNLVRHPKIILAVFNTFSFRGDANAP